jgi:hypothetical protein
MLSEALLKLECISDHHYYVISRDSNNKQDVQKSLPVIVKTNRLLLRCVREMHHCMIIFILPYLYCRIEIISSLKINIKTTILKSTTSF